MLPVFYCVYECTADRCTCGDVSVPGFTAAVLPVCCLNSEI